MKFAIVGFIIDVSLLVLILLVFKISQAILIIFVETVGPLAVAILLAIIYLATLIIEKRKRRHF